MKKIVFFLSLVACGLWLRSQWAPLSGFSGKALDSIKNTIEESSKTPNKNHQSSVANASINSASEEKAATPASGELNEFSKMQNSWKNISKSLQNYHDLDQEALNEIYQQAMVILESNDILAVELLNSQISRFVHTDLVEGIFLIQTWMKTSLDPARLMESFLDFPAPLETKNLPSHHVETNLERYRKLQSFSLHEFQQKIRDGQVHLNSEDHRRVVRKLQNIAQQEKSWDVLLEVFETLKQLKENKVIEMTLEQYQKKDREFFSAYLNINDY